MALCRLVVVIAIVAQISVFASGQHGGRGGGGRGKGGAPAWGTRGGGKAKGPPPETIKACERLTVRAQCSFLTPRKATKTGICMKDGPKRRKVLRCRPTRPQRGRSQDGRRRHRPQGGRPPPPQGGKPPPPQSAGSPPPNDPQQRHRVNSSIDGCVGKKVEDDCTFRPPVPGDQEARGFAANKGPLRGGKKQRGWQGRKGDFQNRRGPPMAARPERPGICVPVARPNGENISFCRMLPPPEALVPCEDLDVGDKCAFTTNGTQTYVGLKVSTGKQAMAETKGTVLASFLIHGEWTEPELFFTGASQGEEKMKTFVLHGWPQLVSLTIWSNDAWCFWKISVNGTVILEDPKGAAGTDAYYKDDATSTYSDSRFWIEGPPSSQIFDVPAKVSTGRRLASVVPINLRIFTATGQHAATKGSVFARLMVQGKWTKSELMFSGAAKGEEKLKKFEVAAWPEKVFISTNSSDAYSYWKIMINEQDVVEDPSGSAGAQGYDPMDESLELGETTTQFWVASPPSSQSFPIPGRLAPRGSRKHHVRGTCQQAWWDMLNGTLHCRPGNSLPAREGGEQPNRMTPDFDMKSQADAATSGAQATESAVELKMIVTNVDYAMLMSNSRLALTFTSSIQKQIAQDAGQGVYSKDVKVTLASGSVVVIAEINPAAFVSRSYLRNKLTLASKSVSQNIAAVVAKIPGIARVSTGPISVSPATLSAASPVQKDEKKGGGKSRALVVIAGASCAIAICMCFVSFCMWRKLRNQKANPTTVEVNGTTVAVGRPVEADHQVTGKWQTVSGGTPVHPVAAKETCDGKPN